MLVACSKLEKVNEKKKLFNPLFLIFSSRVSRSTVPIKCLLITQITLEWYIYLSGRVIIIKRPLVTSLPAYRIRTATETAWFLYSRHIYIYIFILLWKVHQVSESRIILLRLSLIKVLLSLLKSGFNLDSFLGRIITCNEMFVFFVLNIYNENDNG